MPRVYNFLSSGWGRGGRGRRVKYLVPLVNLGERILLFLVLHFQLSICRSDSFQNKNGGVESLPKGSGDLQANNHGSRIWTNDLLDASLLSTHPESG